MARDQETIKYHSTQAVQGAKLAAETIFHSRHPFLFCAPLQPSKIRFSNLPFVHLRIVSWVIVLLVRWCVRLSV